MAKFYLILSIFLVVDSLESAHAHPNSEEDSQIHTGNCTVSCSHVGPPICGERLHRLKLFTTACEAMLDFCETEDVWRHIDLSICAKSICSAPCLDTGKLIKVCAKNKTGKLKIFRSYCRFRNYACRHYAQKWSMERNCLNASLI